MSEIKREYKETKKKQKKKEKQLLHVPEQYLFRPLTDDKKTVVTGTLIIFQNN